MTASNNHDDNNYYIALWRAQLQRLGGPNEAPSEEQIRIHLNHFRHFWIEWRRIHQAWHLIQWITAPTADSLFARSILPAFLSIALDSLWRDVIVSLSALHDRTNKTIALNSWISGMKLPKAIDHSHELDGLLQRFDSNLHPIRDMRHNHIAHWNLKRVARRNAPTVEAAQVAGALDALDRLIQLTWAQYGLTQLDWDIEDEAGGVRTLIEWLRLAEQKSDGNQDAGNKQAE